MLGGGAEYIRLVVPGFGPVWVHSAIHKLNDTRHRNITYRFRAATRFREYFDSGALASSGDATVDGVADDADKLVGWWHRPRLGLSAKRHFFDLGGFRNGFAMTALEPVCVAFR